MNVLDLVNNCENELTNTYKNIDNIAYKNSKKVLDAFHKFNVSESHFNSTTGYGYNDIGRETVEKVYADVFKAEDSLVRTQLISGTHALTVTLFALLRPNDILLSITNKPYDTLDEVIGIKENPSSLKSFGVKYEQIDLINNDFDFDAKVIIMIDNCYCEFVTDKEPIEVGADICVGSLIKNLGAGIVSTGAYIVGRKDLINLCAERLTAPGEGKEIGPSLGNNKLFLQGLYMAPEAVKNALKTAILLSKVLNEVKIECLPKYNDARSDIVEKILFK